MKQFPNHAQKVPRLLHVKYQGKRGMLPKKYLKEK